MFNAEQLQEKWAPLLNSDSADPIKDAHRKMVTAVLLENQEKFLSEERNFLTEAPTNLGNAAVLHVDSVAEQPLAVQLLVSTQY